MDDTLFDTAELVDTAALAAPTRRTCTPPLTARRRHQDVYASGAGGQRGTSSGISRGCLISRPQTCAAAKVCGAALFYDHVVHEYHHFNSSILSEGWYLEELRVFPIFSSTSAMNYGQYF